MPKLRTVFALLNLMKMGLFAAKSIGYNPRHLLAIPVMMLWNSAKLPGRSRSDLYPKALKMRGDNQWHAVRQAGTAVPLLPYDNSWCPHQRRGWYRWLNKLC
jgi:hypothetical protein